MREELVKIKKNFEAKIKKVISVGDLKAIERDFLARKGALRKILSLLKSLDKKERKTIGKRANNLRRYIKAKLKEKKKILVTNKDAFGEEAWLDLSLPGKRIPQGHLHPLTQILTSVERVFESMGFSIFLTPELETEFYNFDALNIPADHPARDLWDTFWLEDNQKIPNSKPARPAGGSQKLLLRTHTTAMQLHYMKEHNPPFRIITPGKCFRYEASDSSHDIQFYQIDGLVVDKDVSVSNFKAVIEELFRRIFSAAIEIRIRPGYFPFVEPGFEVDIACLACYNAKGDISSKACYNAEGDISSRARHKYQARNCPICKGSGWLEIMGAGMVHPQVFKNAGYNPSHWQGFAFGMGIDRIAMIKYGVSDIRLFYQNDLRFLRQF